MKKSHCIIRTCKKGGMIISIARKEDYKTRVLVKKKEGNFTIEDQLMIGHLRILSVHLPNEKFQNA